MTYRIMLSIIIPTLNEEKRLPRLLDSFKKQDLEDYEVIVADSDSADKTRDIARSYGCRITSGGLPAKARNQGAKIAQGDYFLFLDADMAIAPGGLKKLLAEFAKRKLDVAAFFLRPFGNNLFHFWAYTLFHNWPLFVLQKIVPYGTAAALIKKELYQQIGGYDEKVVFLEDSVFLKKAAQQGKFGMLKSSHLFFSQRRFQEKGWLKTYLKIGLGVFYTFLFGPIKKDIFRYWS